MTERQLKQQNWNKEWNHSISGVCKRLWHHNTKSSIKRGHPAPEYSQQELEEWLLAQPNFNQLYTDWAESDFAHFKSVSIDRLDNSKGYSFDNIQLVDFQTNCDNAYRDVRHKVLHNPTLLNGGHRAVTRLTLRGTPICSYISMSAAAEAMNSDRHQSISQCCLGDKLYWRDSIWCYSDKYEDFIINQLPDISKRAIAEYILKNSLIQQYSLEGKFIASYSTIVEAAKSTGLTTNLVSKWIQGKSTVIKPTFIFERKEPEIE